MALTLAGHVTSRRDGLRLFGASTQWTGASHASISEAIFRRTGRVDQWQHSPARDEQATLTWLRKTAASLQGCPAVVTSYCQHRTLNLLCGHSFVLVGLTSTHLQLLDPLGKRPARGTPMNVLLALAQQPRDGLLGAVGAVWDLCASRQISVLKVESASVARTQQDA